MMRILSILLTITWLLSACTASPTPVPVQVSTAASSPTPASLFSSSGGGEPRTTGYWLLWNSCAENNQAETAKANGGDPHIARTYSAGDTSGKAACKADLLRDYGLEE